MVLWAWAGLVVTLGVILSTGTILSWMVISSVALIPVMIGNRLWDAPEPTLSELITRARSRT
jgi:hypothetical protein